MKNYAIICFVCLLWACGPPKSVKEEAPPVIGFWEVTKVAMGDQSMTPIAKWTKIDADGTYTSGNGWLQNSKGTWTFDASEKSFLPQEIDGIKDAAGAFTVRTEDENMIWEREEEGMTVTVTLRPISEIPESTANQIVGLWDLTEVQENGGVITDEFDPEGKHYIHIRWDRVYRSRTPEGNRATGYWHIHGHRPEVTLLPHSKETPPESWMAEVNGSVLIIRGNSDSNKGQVRTYRRLSEFPQ